MSGRIPNVNPYKDLIINPHNNWDDPYGSSYGGRNDPWAREYSSTKAKRKHEFSPILLINTTVYDCKHCKAKKEDCLTEFCDEPEQLNIGDWG